MTKEPLFAQERQMKIVELINQKHKLLVPELCEMFEVSPATIRNDLNELEGRGLLRRTHGGAISIRGTGFEANSNQKKTENLAAKEAIAIQAASLVQDGETLLIDTGTTTEVFAGKLLSKKGLTVVTNDLHIAAMLEEGSDAVVHFVGGMLRKGFHCTVGPLALMALASFRVDRCFFSANGLSAEGGITTPDMNQAELKRTMLNMGGQHVLLLDSSKFGRDCFVRIAGLDALDVLISDANPSQDVMRLLNNNGTQVQVADNTEK